MVRSREGETHQMYLGDGVYASFDGFNIWLRTERNGRVHEIALEPEVLGLLTKYADAVPMFQRLRP